MLPKNGREKPKKHAGEVDTMLVVRRPAQFQYSKAV